MTVAPTAARLGAALSRSYRIDRELGAGGMATVYLAHDLKHDRDVAIKVLHPDLGAALGGERFLSEIRTTARLQHPHILPLLDSGDADGLLYYVMPLVTGETLRARLEREQQLPIDDALRIAREVADALGAAHAQGIIHRDIKPENILLQGGHALVADFGIALAVQTAGGQRMTQTGLSLGTPQYMSPEQAMGEKALDARSDIYALGAVTYEMLTGEPPFTGPNVQAIVAKVLSSEPEPISTIRKSVPSHVAAAVHTAIEKLPADRYATAAAFVQALGNTGTTHVSTRSGAASDTGAPSGWRTLAFATSTFAFVAVAVMTYLLAQPRPAVGPTEYDVALSDSAGMAMSTPFALAPNGTFVIYPTDITPERWELWYRSLLDGTTRRIDGSTGAMFPAISRDSKSLAFVRSRDSVITIEQMPVAGGKAAVLAQVKSISEVMWLDDGHVLSVEADGNRARTLDVGGGPMTTRPIPYCIGASLLADGHSILCAGGGAKYASSIDIRADTLTSLAARHFTLAGDSVLVHGSQFRVVDEHYLVYESKSGDLLAARIDLAKGTIGRPVRMLTGLALRDYSGAGSYAISANGSLVYATGANHAVGYLVRQGEHSLDTLPIGREAFLLYAMSPDGKRIAAAVDVLDGQELRVYDIATGKYDVLATAEDIRQPVWSPTGDRIAYSVPARGGTSAVYVRTLNSTAPVKPVLSIHGFEASAWLPDGRLFGADWNNNLALAVHIEQQPITIDTLVHGALFIKPSPDGRWLAYSSSDLTSLWLEPLPSNGRRYAVHTGSGIDDPHWLTPTELIFKNYQGVPGFNRTTITKGSENPVGTPRRWLDTPRNLDTPGFSSALTPDGGVMYLQADIEAPVRALRVIPNWVTRMKRAVDDAKR